MAEPVPHNESANSHTAFSGSSPATRAPQGTVTPQGTLAVYEPGSGKLLGEVRVATPDQVRETVQAARAAQADWARKSFNERRDVLLRFKDLLLQRADEFCDHISRENGKTRNESLFMEVLPVADAVHWYANNARKLLKDEKLSLHMFPHKKSYLRFYPRGVIGLISPWNYAFSIPTGDAVAALMAGNAVIVKPSEYQPIIMEKTRALLEEAGLARGLFGVVQGKGDVGAEMIRSGVNMIVFTGSVATGKKVNVAAAEQMIPCVLELGGKDPAIVLPDADIDSAAKKIAWGAFANSGQTCASVERVYVHESIANQLIAGTVMHNDTLYTHAAPETPWGGVKSSGLGRVHGKHGMRDFCEVRHVNLERVNFPAFWYYPYSRKAWSTGLRVYRTLLGRGLSNKLKALFGKH